MRNLLVTAVLFSFCSPVFADDCRWGGATSQICKKEIPYVVTHNYAANNCEFYVDSFAEGSWSHNGSNAQWIEASLKVDIASLEEALNGKVLAAGLYSEKNYFYALQSNSGVYRVGMTHQLIPNAQDARPLGSFAFFVDVKREGGSLDRLWLTNAEENFTKESVFANADTTTQSLGSGTLQWVAETSVIFNQAKACRNK